MRYPKILALLPVLLLCAAPTFSQAAVDVNFSVSLAPPELPVYVQPPLPEPGYIWTPGYWGWDGMDYYWVPGTWVLPPVNGMLWTPGYWGWRDGFYAWNPGYWGPEVGFYGGIDYGYGYGGSGYQGGYWHGGAFFYNRSVANFGRVNIVNVYTAPAPHWGSSHVSFNGGRGGVRAQPSEHDRVAMGEHHSGLTTEQLFEAIEHAKGGRMPELVYLGTSLHEEASDMPARVADGIVERGTDRSVRCLHVGTAVDQRAGHVDIVAARCPVQGRLGARLVRVSGVRVSACFDEHPHDLGTVWKVAGPVGDHVEGRASFGSTAESRRSEARVVGEQPLQCGNVAGMDRGNRIGELAVGRHWSSPRPGRSLVSPSRL